MPEFKMDGFLFDAQMHRALAEADNDERQARWAFRTGAQECREMLARFVEQGGDAITAASLRANWNPEWGVDPGPP